MPSVPISESNEQRHTHYFSLRRLIYDSKETTFHREAAELD